jgi:hypothetical protein
MEFYSNQACRSKPAYSWIEPKMLWTMRVLDTTTRHVPYGSLLILFFFEYFE